MYTIQKVGSLGDKSTVLISGNHIVGFGAAKTNVWPALTQCHLAHNFKSIVSSHITGIGEIAANWASCHGLSEFRYYKDHDADGVKADDMRIERMFEETKPDAVIMFPGAERLKEYVSADCLLIYVQF
jgi:hypothetical protein